MPSWSIKIQLIITMFFKNTKILVVLSLLILIATCTEYKAYDLKGRITNGYKQDYKSGFQFDSQGQNKQQCCDRPLFNMNGYGSISAAPDVAKLYVSFQQIGQTSQDAIQAVNRKVNSLLNILSNIGIQQKDISTNALSVYPRYNYINGNQIFLGYAAYQNIIITLRNIGNNGSGVGPVIDRIAVVDGIRVENITFDLENKTIALSRARQAAFNNALSKAKDYASFSGTSVGRVLKIQDYDFQVGSTIPQNGALNKGQGGAGGDSPSVIISDNLTVSVGIIITFEIKN